MTKKWMLIVMALSLTVVLAACQTTGQGSKTYARGQAQSAMSVYSGTVLKVAEVQIQGEQTGVGAVVGSVVGGIVGSTIGSGRGKTLATTGGAVGGLAAGSATEKNRATKVALEIEVELDDGRLMVVVQEKDDQYAVGDRIRLIQSPDGSVRIRQ